MKNEMQRILVVAAHPDDEVLGCGGTIIKHALDGDEVHILIMAEGLTSRNNQRDINVVEHALNELHENSKRAAEILGAKSITLCNLPDNRMDSLDLLDVIKKVESTIGSVRPDVVYTHHVGDVNIDHQIVHKAVVTACRSLPDQFVNTILFFETPSSTEWQIASSDKAFLPNWFVDIEDTFSKKMDALRCYDSEMRNYPHPRSYAAIEILAKYRGTTIGHLLAEAFMLGRTIN